MSNEYDAVRHVLSAPRLAARTSPYIGEDDFDFTGLRREAETMSGGEQLLVRIADELWSAEKRAGFWELVRRLDVEYFERVLEGLRIARGTYAWNPVAVFVVDPRLAA